MKNLKLKKEIITVLNRNSMRKIFGKGKDTGGEDLAPTLEKCESIDWCEVSGDCGGSVICEDSKICLSINLCEETMNCEDTDY